MRINGIELHVEETGRGSPIVFSHGLLLSTRMYDPQVSVLSARHRCIAYDHRGQGQSAMPEERTISIERTYDDAVSLIESLGRAPCHFVGLSMGGFVGMRLAARKPALLRSLILIDTTSEAEPRRNLPRYRALNAITRLGGLRFAAGRVVPIMFGESFLRDRHREAERTEQLRRLRGNRRRIYRAVNGVIGRDDCSDELSAITTPTLVLHGEEDRAISLRRGRELAARIAGAKFVAIPRAGHTATIEAPERVTAEIAGFIAAVEAAPSPSAT